jgi:hypothetical protein
MWHIYQSFHTTTITMNIIAITGMKVQEFGAKTLVKQKETYQKIKKQSCEIFIPL